MRRMVSMEKCPFCPKRLTHERMEMGRFFAVKGIEILVALFDVRIFMPTFVGPILKTNQRKNHGH